MVTKSPSKPKGTKAKKPKVKEEQGKPDGTKRFTPDEIERRIEETKSLAGYQTPERHLLDNLLKTLKAEDSTLCDNLDKAKAKVQECFGYSKDVSKKTLALKQSITERHFEAGEQLEKMAWLLRGCYETWRKSEQLPETTTYRARELFKAAKDIDEVKGMTLTEAYKKFSILQPPKPTLNKLLVSVEKRIISLVDGGLKPADVLDVSNCSSTIKCCHDQLNKVAASIKSMAVLKTEATIVPAPAKTVGKKKLKETEHQLMA